LHLTTDANLVEMILEFAVWRAVPRAGQPEGKRSLCDGCYAVEFRIASEPWFHAETQTGFLCAREL